jgi:hypothetical protein
MSLQLNVLTFRLAHRRGCIPVWTPRKTPDFPGIVMKTYSSLRNGVQWNVYNVQLGICHRLERDKAYNTSCSIANVQRRHSGYEILR